MQDDPPLADLVDAVAAFLRERAVPGLDGHARYEARVSAGVLALVSRALRAGDAPAVAELDRLRALLDRDGDLAALNAALADRLLDGSLTLETPGVADHLWRTACDKAAVDRPDYATVLKQGGCTPVVDQAARSGPSPGQADDLGGG